MTAYDAFAPIYKTWSAGMTEDVAFYAGLVREADGPVVELAVGTGRVGIPVARETGKRIVGIDSSRGMLERARADAERAGVDLVLREADMRTFELDAPAALVYCPFRSLLHLPTWADKRAAFERVAGSLRSGGRFAWNAFVFDYTFAARNEGHHDEPVPHTVIHSPAESRVDLVLDSGAAVSLWWATKAEWEGLVDVSGLETEALYGDFDRTPFGEESREFVWVARKP